MLEEMFRGVDRGIYWIQGWLDSQFYYPILPGQEDLGLFMLGVIPLVGIAAKVFIDA